jgi:hypothetical protein
MRIVLFILFASLLASCGSPCHFQYNVSNGEQFLCCTRDGKTTCDNNPDHW